MRRKIKTLLSKLGEEGFQDDLHVGDGPLTTWMDGRGIVRPCEMR